MLFVCKVVVRQGYCGKTETDKENDRKSGTRKHKDTAKNILSTERKTTRQRQENYRLRQRNRESSSARVKVL